MALKIGFLTTLGVNVGDEFIREGLRAVLDASGVDYTPLYVNKHDPASLHTWAEDECVAVADKFRECDLFLQSGAPVYWRLHDGAASSLNSEWHQWMWVDRLLAPGPGPVFANLGAGSCQAWGDGPEVFLADPACADFARQAGRRAALTTVRDPLAARILSALEVPHHALSCPAFLAGARHRQVMRVGGPVGVNLMPLGGHWDLDGFDAAAWEAGCHLLLAGLRALGPLLLIAHDETERVWLERFAAPGERVFLGRAWREYFDAYASCALVVANRVHGAICAAGFGVPALIMGNDSRAEIGRPLGLPIFRSGGACIPAVLSQAAELHRDRAARREELLAQREALVGRYVELLAPVLGQAQAGGRP